MFLNEILRPLSFFYRNVFFLFFVMAFYSDILICHRSKFDMPPPIKWSELILSMQVVNLSSCNEAHFLSECNLC